MDRSPLILNRTLFCFNGSSCIASRPETPRCSRNSRREGMRSVSAGDAHLQESPSMLYPTLPCSQVQNRSGTVVNSPIGSAKVSNWRKEDVPCPLRRALGRAGHRPWPGRRLLRFPWHETAAADLARRRMGAR